MARPQTEEAVEDQQSDSSRVYDEAMEDGHEGAVEQDEEEFHTASSQQSDKDDDNDSEVFDLAPTTPLLPIEILKPLPSPVQSLEVVPWDRLTRKQKVARRNQSRQAKKLQWEQLRRSTNGTAVLEAGKAAQLKRGVIPSKTKVRSGRVGKKTNAKVRMSGRQQLVEDRKRLAGQRTGVVVAPSVKKSKKVKDKR